MNLLATILALGLTIGLDAPETPAGAEERVWSLPNTDPGEDAACDLDERLTPESRTEAGPRPALPEPSGCLMLGVGLHGARFRITGEGTARNPLQISFPIGSLIKAVIQIPYSSPNVRYEGSFLYW